MFGDITDWLYGVFSWLGSGLTSCWNWAWKYIGTKWALLMLLFSWGGTVLMQISGAWNAVAGLVNNLIIHTLDFSGWQTVLSWLAIGNAFFPVEEGMQLLVSYLTLWLALIAIKLGLKTWSWFAGTNVSNGPF
jgi:hypothetical protein